MGNSSFEYNDKVIVITGGSKGIGAGCARVFKRAGAKVVICARNEADGQKLAEELDSLDEGACRFVKCDVSNPDEIKYVIDYTLSDFGRLDCLINNAGYHCGFKPIDEFSIEDFHNILQTNLVSYFVACKYALPHIRKVKGSIINMGSLVGIMGQQMATIYAAAKGGIASFTKSLAIEEAAYGVRINCVSPGNILSDSRIKVAVNSKNGTELDRMVDSWQPVGHSGTIEDVGNLCLFLASEASAFITGADIIISGGAELGYGIKYPLVIPGATN